MKIILFSCMAVALLSGCGATRNVQIYGNIDSANKTVEVGPGSSGLKGKLKQAMAQDGWKLVISGGHKVIEGEIGEKTMLRQYDTLNARYRLIASWQHFNGPNCVAKQTVQYDISLIDNQSGAEVFTLNGRDCEGYEDVIHTFSQALKGNIK